uniref:Uncharacterized protein n=1 Tax=Rhizophora mucronata TaxID=61149 RepID=A0A2P2L9Z5_RHIMU
MENSSLEQTLQDGKLHRELNTLIVAHLRDNNLTQAASAVASATMTPLNVETPPNKLLELVAKVILMNFLGILGQEFPFFFWWVATELTTGYGSGER